MEGETTSEKKSKRKKGEWERRENLKLSRKATQLRFIYLGRGIDYRREPRNIEIKREPGTHEDEATRNVDEEGGMGKTQLEIGRRKNMEARENEIEINREYVS